MAGRVVRQHDNYFVTHDSSISPRTTVPFRHPRQFHFCSTPRQFQDQHHDSSNIVPSNCVPCVPTFLIKDHCVRYSTCVTVVEGAGVIYQGSVFWCAIVVGYVVVIHASAGSRL
ncbi:hypothetical protein M758_UG030800 [Ceratodon purpureus]|nr:hypothetical protein M758_UG030800 [Ceratodon purpureus]